MLACAALALVLSGCRAKPQQDAQKFHEQIVLEIRAGALRQAEADLRLAQERFGRTSAEWSWKFRVLEAQVRLSQSATKEALAAVEGEMPASLTASPEAVRQKMYQGIAYRMDRQFALSREKFGEAEQIAIASQPALVCEVLNSRSALDVEEGKYDAAEEELQRALVLAKQTSNARQVASILLNLAWLSANRGNLDEAVDRNQAALAAARSQNMQALVATILGNLGSAYFSLGDLESAQKYFSDGAKLSEELGLNGYSAYWYTGVAGTYMAQHDYARAREVSEETLRKARTLNEPDTITICLNTLADLSLHSGDLEAAQRYSDEATKLVSTDADHLRINASRILSARILARRGEYRQGEALLREVSRDPLASPAAKWEAHARLAELYAAEGKPAQAEAEFSRSLDSIQEAREAVAGMDLRLSFLSNSIDFYGEYVDFLMARKRPLDALKVAELSRARMLVEGLSESNNVPASRVRRLKPEEIARKRGATILFYWLGQEHSYVWAIQAKATTAVELPPEGQLRPKITAAREGIRGLRDLGEASGEVFRELYAELVAPVQKLLPADGNVALINDPELSVLNFETLVAPEPKAHYWIDDVTLTNASSLTLLAKAETARAARKESLLIVGNPQAVEGFPALPKADEEMKRVERYFEGAQVKVVRGEAATPKAVLASSPGEFQYLHFVTHGTASTTRPLDSAVILSPGAGAYKLYARDIVGVPLGAELVTISACEGSSGRAYSGEGLVGLSWAFLRAGAHNVVGALWEVNDSAAPEIMDEFYAGLRAGKPPASALRAAKLRLLHPKDPENVFRKPFYWAAFQLYTGS